MQGFALDFHSLLNFAYLQIDVNHQCSVDVQDQSGLTINAKTGLLNFNRVMAQREGLERVKTRGIRVLALLDAGIVVDHSHGRACYGGPTRVLDRAGDARSHSRESTTTGDEERERGQREGELSKQRTQGWSVSVQRPM